MDLQTAQNLDLNDTLSNFRSKFLFPKTESGETYLYFCGNSLGLQPTTAKDALNVELEDWAKFGVEGHFEARNPWFDYHEFFNPFSVLFGAKPHEYCVMGALTTNLHLLMVSFYNPTPKRFKILIEQNPFPSDNYAVQTQAEFHGYTSEEAIIYAKPSLGKDVITTEDILQIIETQGTEIELVMLSGVNYFTGQFFDIPKITEAAQNKGCKVGWDLAHAAGNVKLELNKWNVDFAAWCGYKYLNSGPGSVASIFVHEKHAQNYHLKRFAGWWSNDPKTRFQMPDKFVPQFGAVAWQTSNAPVFQMAIHKASLELFMEAGMENLIDKSKKLTKFLYDLLSDFPKNKLEIITPEDPQNRGCQVSIRLFQSVSEIQKLLRQKGIIVDIRQPDVIRIAPVPMYNSYTDVWLLVSELKKIIL